MAVHPQNLKAEMQTNFTPKQLENPRLAEADQMPSLVSPESGTPTTWAVTATVIGHELKSRVVKTSYCNHVPNWPIWRESLPIRANPQFANNELGKGI